MNWPASARAFLAASMPPQLLTKSAATSMSSTNVSSGFLTEAGFDSAARLAMVQAPDVRCVDTVALTLVSPRRLFNRRDGMAISFSRRVMVVGMLVPAGCAALDHWLLSRLAM